MPSRMQTHIAAPASKGVDPVEDRGDEEKCELNRLGDARQKRSQRSGNHDAGDFGPILRTGGESHGGRGRGQAPHLEKIAAGHIAGGRIAAMKRAISPCTPSPVLGSTKSPAWKKNGTFQTWCRPNGIRARSTTP